MEEIDNNGNNSSDSKLLPTTFRKRCYAYIIDLILINFCTFLIIYNSDGVQATLAKMGTNWSFEEYMRSIQLAVEDYFIYIHGFILIYWIPEILFGKSIGKFLMKLEIGTVDGHKCERKLYLQRFAVRHSPDIIIMIGIIIQFQEQFNFTYSMLMMVFYISCYYALGEKRLTLHDRLSGTSVFRKDDLITESGF